MSYHVNRQGQSLGVFSLEELRRRRALGEFAGTEWVWREGMAQWQLMDLVLRQSVAAPSPVTPPPPLAGARPPRRKWVLPVAIGLVALLFAAGLGMAGFFLYRTIRQAQPWLRAAGGAQADAVALAGRPIVWHTNSLTEADVRRQGRTFRVRQWLEGYRQRGRRDAAYDPLAERLIASWIEQTYGDGSATNLPAPSELGSQLAANPACQEPLLLTIAAITGTEVNESVRRLERALAHYDASRHWAYPRLCATVELAARVPDDADRIRALDESSLRWLRQAFQDGSFRPEDQAQVAELLLNGRMEGLFHRHQQAAVAAAQSAGPAFEWLQLVLEGQFQINEAWRARGSGYADKVSERGWEGFRTHLAAARKNLTRAWTLRPDLSRAPSLMVTVSLGDSGLEEMRLWFDRATTARIDDNAAWSNLRWGLRPRWYGSLESMRALGVAAVQTGRFDTDVPRKFFDVVQDLEAEEKLAVGQHLLGRDDLWPHLQQMYEGYIREPAQAAHRDSWRSSYAAVAYLAGHYDVARQQLEPLNWKPGQWNLTGWGADLSLLPLEVAARTGASAERVKEAESDYRDGSVAKALRGYQEIKATPGLDDLTSQFVRCRVASLEIEQDFAGGDWVNLLPREEEDPNWVEIWGKSHRQADGSLEVRSLDEGHLLFSRARLGVNFEARGEFEVVRSSDRSFQAGLAVGVPSTTHSDWFAFRMKRNDTEGELAAVSSGWTRSRLKHSAALKEDRNTFDFALRDGKVTAAVNGKEVFHDAALPGRYPAPAGELRLGLGAYHDMNETVIRYRKLEVRKLAGP